MTAQISDKVLYQQKSCAIAGINGSGLFEPLQYAIKPVAVSTACWRGYYCTYEVADKSLFLIQINIGLSKEDQFKAEQTDSLKLFGKIPARYNRYEHLAHRIDFKLKLENHKGSRRPMWMSSDFRVDGLRELIAFTGGLLLGEDFIQEMYVHMGFHPAYKFRNVYELVFDRGQVVEEHDRSLQMSQFREKFSFDASNARVRASNDEIKQWIKQSFSLEYQGFSM